MQLSPQSPLKVKTELPLVNSTYGPNKGTVQKMDPISSTSQRELVGTKSNSIE